MLALLLVLPVVQGDARGKGAARAKARKHPLPALLGVDPPLASPATPALPPLARQLISEVPSDPAPPALTRNSHYWVSNEHHHAVWQPRLSNLGGVHLGVGTDQNFLLAGWTRPELMLLMDFDGKIPLLHSIYGLFFKTTATPARFIKRWNPRYIAESRELIRGNLAMNKPKLARTLNKIFTVAQPAIWSRLRRVKKTHVKLGLATFLSDQAQYDHLRGLWQQGRVLALRGNLTGRISMRGLARALRLAGMELGVLYLSNAEQYFKYGPDFRRNIIEMPWSSRGLTLRTLAWGCHGLVSSRDLYHYNVQSGRNFTAWMAHSQIEKAGKMLFHKTGSGMKGVSVLDREATVSRYPPTLAPAFAP